MEYLNVPTKVGIGLVGLFFIIQIIGELLEFKGKVVPEFIKIRKYFIRKKKEREALSKVTEFIDDYINIKNKDCEIASTLEEVKTLLNDVRQHYDTDNITKRDKWIDWVNNQAVVYDNCLAELEKKMDKNNAITLSLLIDGKRNTIINFASNVIDENYPVTREQFNRILKIYEEYEQIIEENELKNGEVDIAIRIIRESYEKHMKTHTFVEDVRGYDI
jgi:transcriptional regulator of heat shock response